MWASAPTTEYAHPFEFAENLCETRNSLLRDLSVSASPSNLPFAKGRLGCGLLTRLRSRSLYHTRP